MIHFLLILFFSKALLNSFSKEHILNEWTSYKDTHKLSFSEQEDSERRDIFWDNYLYIKNHNEKKSSYKLALNKFAHLRHEEVNRGLKMKLNRKMKGVEVEKVSDLPVAKSRDWRLYGVVAPVKDQKRCGSCYSFSAISAIESAEAIRKGYLTELSEQEVLDCSHGFGNMGCDGGFMDNVFEFAISQGVSEESQYRYLAKDEQCIIKNMTHSHRVLSYRDIPQGDEQKLIRAVSFIGPVSVAIDASPRDFRFYHSGVLDIESCSQDNLDHGVVVVGYDLTAKVPYHIVRNSWGESWGEKGYFKLAILKNMCGVATAASYPIMAP